MRKLLIDGEYLKKYMNNSDLAEVMKRIFGIFPPDETIYYTANMFDEEIESMESSIPNFKINNKGWIQEKKSKGTKQQKGVDGYIVVDLVVCGYEDISDVYLFAGDGDLKAGVEKYTELTGNKVKLIGVAESISMGLKETCDCYPLDKDIFTFKEEIKKVEEKIEETEEIQEVKKEEEVQKSNIDKENIIKKLSDKGNFYHAIVRVLKDYKNLPSSQVGQKLKDKKYNYKLKKGRLNKNLQELKDCGLVNLEKVGKKSADYYITIL